MAGSALLRPEAPEAGMIDPQPIGLVGTFGIGGVLTADGEYWQYRPDKERWVTLDESFALEGQATSIAPLPIPVAKIRHMETFGFLIADNNDCWLYDLDNRVWRNIGKPPYRERR
jgi:hypothetical protein